jgi:hypothetical protein
MGFEFLLLSYALCIGSVAVRSPNIAIFNETFENKISQLGDCTEEK